MWQLFREWLILPPAKSIADLFALVLWGGVPVALALTAGFGTFYLLQPHKQSYPYQWWGLAVFCTLSGVYILLVGIAAIDRLPAALSK